MVRFDESFAGLDQAGAAFVKLLREKGAPLEADIPYELDLAKAQENARNMIAKLKDAKVTTVIFAGDPVTPGSLTSEATAQNYFPEWVVLGAAYTDTSLFGRSYDQKQWAHAFGVSTLFVPVKPEADQLYSILVWQSGKGPVAKTFKVLVQAPLIFYTALQLAGPGAERADVPRRVVPLPVRPDPPDAAAHLLGQPRHLAVHRLLRQRRRDADLVEPRRGGRRRGRGTTGKGMWEYARDGQALPPRPVAEG